jgi:hypothetical protein
MGGPRKGRLLRRIGRRRFVRGSPARRIAEITGVLSPRAISLRSDDTDARWNVLRVDTYCGGRPGGQYLKPAFTFGSLNRRFLLLLTGAATKGIATSLRRGRWSVRCPRSHFRRLGQVGERRAVWPVEKILTPFVPDEVAVGDLTSDALPGFDGRIQQHDGTASADAASRGAGLAVGAERHAEDVALLDGERFLRQAPTRGRVEQHHAAAAAECGSSDCRSLERRGPVRCRNARPVASRISNASADAGSDEQWYGEAAVGYIIRIGLQIRPQISNKILYVLMKEVVR